MKEIDNSLIRRIRVVPHYRLRRIAFIQLLARIILLGLGRQDLIGIAARIELHILKITPVGTVFVQQYLPGSGKHAVR